jgi:thiamine biosynthesis lipoprotein
VSTFTSVGCTIGLPDRTPLDGVRALFEARDSRFSRFLPTSELNRVNAAPLGVMLVSEDFASMLSLAIDAAGATGGRVSPAVGGAITAAGYDRDFADLPLDGGAVEPVAVQSIQSIRLRGRMLLRSAPVVLDLNGVVKGRTVDEALALLGSGWVSAGGDIATNVPLDVGLPGGDSVHLTGGGLATSSIARRAWVRGGVVQHHLIDPASGRPAAGPWRDVTVAAGRCLAADVAAKAALLHGDARPAWLDARGLAGRFVGHDGEVIHSTVWRELTTVAPLAA